MLCQEAPNHFRLIAEENFTLQYANKIRHELIESTQRCGSPSCILDLTRIEEMDSSGLQLVLGLLKSLEAQQRTLKVEIASPTIRKVFELCHLNQLVTIEEVS